MTRPDRAGFTLLETLIALAILVSAASVLFGIFGDSLYRSSAGRSEAMAATIAGSILDRVGNDLPLRDGEVQGNTKDGFDWTVTITPYGSDDDRASWAASPYLVTVLVSWGRHPVTRSITLQTIRLGSKGAS